MKSKHEENTGMNYVQPEKTGITPAAFAALSKGSLENFLVAMKPGGIEAQETAGQIEQSLAETLPIDLGTKRLLFEELGFVFGEPVDDLFISAKFPPGWQKRITDHSMWTEIIDSKGRIRGGIFYKAAFYDRRADAHLSCRFKVDRVSDEKNQTQTIAIKDECSVVKKSKVFSYLSFWETSERSRRKYYTELVAVETAFTVWLTENYPDWRNPMAYWE